VLFSVRDFEILRILRWCRYISPSDLKAVFSDAEVSNLIGAGLIKLHTGSSSLILTGKGQRLLDEECEGDVPHVVPSYRDTDIARRVRTAKLMLTAYRAGIHIFTMGLADLTSGPALFLPSLVRGRGSNPWGNTRVTAIGQMGDLLCAFHNLYPNTGKLVLTDELRAFTGNTSGIRGTPSMILSGDSYKVMLDELNAARLDTGNRLAFYGEAYRHIPLPVHLLSCDETGARQLQIMSEPDYRKRLTLAALRGQYQPPMKDLDCDATFEGVPFLMAADMDLRRFDATLEKAISCGYPQIAMVAMEKQVDTVFKARYRGTDRVRMFVLTESALAEFFGHPPALYSPPDSVYQSKKGDVLYAPLIQAHRKAIPTCGEK